jgi:hypothetical protein
VVPEHLDLAYVVIIYTPSNSGFMRRTVGKLSYRMRTLCLLYFPVSYLNKVPKRSLFKVPRVKL